LIIGWYWLLNSPNLIYLGIGPRCKLCSLTFWCFIYLKKFAYLQSLRMSYWMLIGCCSQSTFVAKYLTGFSFRLIVIYIYQFFMLKALLRCSAAKICLYLAFYSFHHLDFPWSSNSLLLVSFEYSFCWHPHCHCWI